MFRNSLQGLEVLQEMGIKAVQVNDIRVDAGYDLAEGGRSTVCVDARQETVICFPVGKGEIGDADAFNVVKCGFFLRVWADNLDFMPVFDLRPRQVQ